jgi:hypothetical protein
MKMPAYFSTSHFAGVNGNISNVTYLQSYYSSVLYVVLAGFLCRTYVHISTNLLLLIPFICYHVYVMTLFLHFCN